MGLNMERIVFERTKLLFPVPIDETRDGVSVCTYLDMTYDARAVMKATLMVSSN